MNKIKDILYDKNDILVALLIVAIAALVIYTRIEVIMDYPQIQAAAAESSSQAETKDKTSAQKNEQNAAGENESDKTVASEKQVNGTDSKSAEQTNAPSGIVSINIPAGSTLDSIAQQLLDNGLISDKTAFINHMVGLGLDTKVKCGTFQIPGGSSTDEIAAILTK